MTLLAGKVAIITGAAQGMGAAHAELFIQQGAAVVITDVNAEKGMALATRLGEQALFIQQDVTQENDWQHVVKSTLAHFGQLDILVNNAGITAASSIQDTRLEDYRRILEINQVSVFLGMKSVFSAMKANGGAIINVSSINGLVGGAIGYTDSKFAVRGMSKAAALEYAPFNIRVNSVHPGAIATPMLVQEDTKAAVAAFAKTIPLQRIAQPEEVSHLIAYLASDYASYATGAEFILDGGITAQ